MAAERMKVHPSFKAFTKESADAWSKQAGRTVSQVQVTEALAKAFASQGALQVTIVCPAKPGPGRPRLENPFWSF